MITILYLALFVLFLIAFCLTIYAGVCFYKASKSAKEMNKILSEIEQLNFGFGGKIEQYHIDNEGNKVIDKFSLDEVSVMKNEY